MSFTIVVDIEGLDLPTRKERCLACDCDGFDLGLDLNNEHITENCHYCTGKGYKDVPDAPSANFSNGNWVYFLERMGLKHMHSCNGGEIQVKDLHGVMRELIRMSSTPEKHTIEPKESPGYICMGLDEDYITRRALDIMGVVGFAIKHQRAVYWC
jgi:hypothetical protein